MNFLNLVFSIFVPPLPSKYCVGRKGTPDSKQQTAAVDGVTFSGYFK